MDSLDTRIAVSIANQTDAPARAVNANLRSIGKTAREASDEAARSFGKIGKSMGGAGEFAKGFAASISRIPLSYAAAGVAAAAFTTEAIKTGAAAQRSMERFQFGANATGQQIKALGSDMQKLALITGESQSSLTDQFAAFMQQTDMAFDPAKELFTKINLASKVTGSTVGTLSEAVAAASKNMNLSKHDMSGLLDDLVNLPSTISQALAQSIPNVTTMMQNLGMSSNATLKQATQAAEGFSKLLGDPTRGSNELPKILAELNSAPVGRSMIAESGKDIYKLFQNLVPLIKSFNVEKGNVFQLNAFKQATGLDRQDAMAILHFYKMIQQARKNAQDENISLENALKKMMIISKDQMSALQSLSGAWQNLLVAFDNFEVPEGIKALADVTNQIAHDVDVVSKMPSLLHDPLATSGKVSKDIANEVQHYSHGKFFRTPSADEKKAMEAGPLGWRKWAPTWLGGFPEPPHRAAGGPVSANEPYLVGERGPELFVPSSSGSIATQGTIAGMRHAAAEDANTEALKRLTATLEYGAPTGSPYGLGGGLTPSSGYGGGGTPAMPASGLATPSYGHSGSTPYSGGGGTSRAIPKGRQHVAAAVADAFRKAGMSEAGIRGVLANIQDESGFNPANRHADQPRYGGEAHFAHGLFQMGGAQWNSYAAWLNTNHPGADWRDPSLQAEYVAQDIKRNHPSLWRAMNSGSAEGAAQDFVSGFEHPSRANEMRRRAEYGRGVPSLSHYTGMLPEHQAVLDSHTRLQAEIAKRPIRMSVLEPKVPNQLGAVARRIGQRRARQSAEDTLAFMRWNSTSDFYS